MAKKKTPGARLGSGVTGATKTASSGSIANAGPRADTMGDIRNKQRMTKKGGNVDSVQTITVTARLQKKYPKAKPIPNTTRRKKG